MQTADLDRIMGPFEIEREFLDKELGELAVKLKHADHTDMKELELSVETYLRYFLTHCDDTRKLRTKREVEKVYGAIMSVIGAEPEVP